MTTLDHEYVTWPEYINLCERLVAKVGLSGWKFDSLICLARGGMRPGDIFSRVYGLPLAVLSTSSYRAEAGTVQGELCIAKHITGVDTLKGKVLLVDDLCDSGKTISKVIVHLKHEFPEIEEIRVAAMCGVTLSLCNFVKLLVVDRIPIQVAAIVCMTLVVVVLIAKVIGCVLPLTAEHIGFDPAVMASPFITTIVDAISLTVYFTIAKVVLHI